MTELNQAFQSTPAILAKVEPGHLDAPTIAGEGEATEAESIQLAVAAVEVDGALGTMVMLPFGEFPGSALLAMATTEQFTHGWDLARAIGHHTDLDAVIGDAFREPDGRAGRPARRLPWPAGVVRGR